MRPEGGERFFAIFLAGELTEFAWLLSPKPVDARVRPAWPRGTASSLEGRIAEEAEARDGARPALPRLQSVSPQSAPAGGPSSGREAQASAREAERPAPIPAGVGPASLRGTCGASAAHAAWASGVGS